jgi:hypothetical protein
MKLTHLLVLVLILKTLLLTQGGGKLNFEANPLKFIGGINH